MDSANPLWRPAPETARQTLISAFMARAADRSGLEISDFSALHEWSVRDPDAFWSLAWDTCGLVGERSGPAFVSDPDPLSTGFFPEVRLNIVETYLKSADSREAVVFIGEDGRRGTWTRAELRHEVDALAAALKAEGIGRGDRVAGYVANMPQAVAAMLATAALGAVWSSCAPESGVDIVVDRLGQIEPKLMFASDGYFYNGRRHGTSEKIAEIARQIPSIRKVVIWPYADDGTDLPKGAVAYEAFKVQDADPLTCAPMGFRDPLFVMFSSGTTGKPKCIEHSGGGTLLRLLVEHQLHADLRPGDRIFYFSTCSWMMWNWLVAALASEATIILFDGNPMYPNISRLFDLAEAERVSHFGVSAKFIDFVQKSGIRPCETHDLEPLRVVLSTGSPLAPRGYSHVYDDWKSDLQLSSICGGTDILGAFVGGAPIVPVYRGEISCPTLGLDVTTFDETGQRVSGVPGELVCCNTHPSMPTRFLGDDDNARYRASYYSTFPGVWRQGDYAVRTENGGFVILGRSDATLNPGGVRIGTAEIYRQLDKIAPVRDSVVAGKTVEDDVKVMLFVILSDGAELDKDLVNRIKADIRTGASPRHVPAEIHAVPDIPRTASGKIAELAVRDVINGKPVRDLSGVANPEALDHFTRFA